MEETKPSITITTDASYCNNTKWGGWAFWVSCCFGSIKKSGSFKNQLNNSMEAELFCIINAVTWVRTNNILGQDNLTINTDCAGIRDIMNKYREGNICPTRNLAAYYDQLGKLLNEGSPVWTFNHVKAHTNNKSPRSYTNAWCDKASRKAKEDKRREMQVKEKAL